MNYNKNGKAKNITTKTTTTTTIITLSIIDT